MDEVGYSGKFRNRKVAPRGHRGSYDSIPEREAQAILRVLVLREIGGPGLQACRTVSVAFSVDSMATGTIPPINLQAPTLIVKHPQELRMISLAASFRGARV